MDAKEIGKIRKYTLENRSEFINNYWMMLGDTTKIKTTNIIEANRLFKENPSLAVIDLMRRPENFAFTCSVLLNYHLHPFQALILKQLWTHPFSLFIASRGASKTSLLAVYSLLRSLFIPNTKVVFIGSAFRQSKIIFNYCETVYKNAPMFQDILSFDKGSKISHDNDMYKFTIGDSSIVSLPLGTGEKIRGQRSSCTIVDEKNSLNEEIFQEVIQGFASVSINPVEQVKEYYKYKALLDLGDISKIEFDEIESKRVYNQQIDAGTCGFTFEPMYKIWKRYYDIIKSCGNKTKLKQLFNDEIPPGFDYKDYCVIRLPYELLPPKYMDEKTIGKALATTNSGLFGVEYRAIFCSDSNGFFKRSLIQNTTCGKASIPITKKCGLVDFNIEMEGHRDLHYVMGIDPAAESDNFAISILGLWEDHRRVIYTWTTNNENHKAKLRYGLVNEHDYYRYCARKVRDLMKLYNIKQIAIDAQGGGRAIMEILGDPKYLQDREHPIYPIQDDKKPRFSDGLSGLHILTPVEFSNSDWVYNANHGLRQDMETRELVFPLCDSLAFGMLHEMDKIEHRLKISDNSEIDGLVETAEDVLLEVEELKNELVLIEHSKTPNGRDRWDTPTVKGLNQKKGRLRKDRYSALLLANSIGREMIARTVEYKYDVWGGVAKDLAKESKENKRVMGLQQALDEGYSFGMCVKRK